MQIVTNNTLQSVMLEDGTLLAAAGTDGSTKEGVTVSKGDRKRLVDTGKISVSQVKDETATTSGAATKPDDVTAKLTMVKKETKS
ncbi:MAG: hypothetical protein MSG64_07515 [Pyrinomonadaceae bacterium MAG19_C2-C3]|nr:hypothetical protein [Pyrinomonadaceae bacterium MAG19_C2-C3]